MNEHLGLCFLKECPLFHNLPTFQIDVCNPVRGSANRGSFLDLTLRREEGREGEREGGRAGERKEGNRKGGREGERKEGRLERKEDVVQAGNINDSSQTSPGSKVSWPVRAGFIVRICPRANGGLSASSPLFLEQSGRVHGETHWPAAHRREEELGQRPSSQPGATCPRFSRVAPISSAQSVQLRGVC